MDDTEATPDPPRLMFTPLMISLMGIVSTALAIFLYNFIITRFCARRQSHLMPRHTQDCEKGSGVEEKVLHSIPVLSYKTAQGGLLRVDHTECVVCLGEFEEGEIIRLLPNCRHAFHVQCIDEWFFSHSSCPVCRCPLSSSQIDSTVTTTTTQEDSLLDQADTGSNNNRKVLRNCTSVVVREDKVSSVPVDFKRSLSVDCTYVAVKIQRGMERETGSSSSSSFSNEMLLLRTESGSCRSYNEAVFKVM